MKPILFNTEMVQAILEGRKTVTRRVIKQKYSNTHFDFRTDKYGTEFVEIQNQVEGETWGKNPDGSTWRKLIGYIVPKSPYKVGDILYVRETWMSTLSFGLQNGYLYKANTKQNAVIFECTTENPKWRPSIHMPKKAARIFLKVIDVRVERLQDISIDQLNKEGFGNVGHPVDIPWYAVACDKFLKVWNRTIRKQDIDKYGWEANPWVWVIEFERMVAPNE